MVIDFFNAQRLLYKMMKSLCAKTVIYGVKLMTNFEEKKQLKVKSVFPYKA